MGYRAALPRSACVYRFEPYNFECATIVEEETFGLPPDTLHTQLAGKVSFMAYPVDEFYRPPEPMRKDQMARIFIGQLPYQVTDMQLNWLCHTFAMGASVYFPERITKSDAITRAKIPTGCIHAYCDPAIVDDILKGLHKRLLIDDTGVWYANSREEEEELAAYCTTMKSHRSKRPHNRPYTTVVAQHATSTYVPPPPTYNATFAETQ